jgi:predicted transcriptional regulator
MAILETIHENGGANISQISTYANISYSRLKVKLDDLVKAGIVIEIDSDEGDRGYVLTDDGKEALIKLRELTGFLSSLGLIPKQN